MKTIKDLISEEVKANPVQTGYRKIEVKTQLKSDKYSISKCYVTIDLLNQRATTEYGCGVFDAFDNYNNELFVREVVSDKIIA